MATLANNSEVRIFPGLDRIHQRRQPARQRHGLKHVLPPQEEVDIGGGWAVIQTHGKDPDKAIVHQLQFTRHLQRTVGMGRMQQQEQSGFADGIDDGSGPLHAGWDVARRHETVDFRGFQRRHDNLGRAGILAGIADEDVVLHRFCYILLVLEQSRQRRRCHAGETQRHRNWSPESNSALRFVTTQDAAALFD